MPTPFDMGNFWADMTKKPETMELSPTPLRAPASAAPQVGINKAQQAVKMLRDVKAAKEEDADSTVLDKGKLMAYIEQQERDASSLRDQANMYAQAETQADLSPLMALADSWTGSKLAASYKPFTAEEKANKVAQLRKLAGDAEGDAAKNQAGMMGLDIKADSNMMKMLAAMAGGQSAERRERLDSMHGREIQTQMNKMDENLSKDRVNLSGAEAALKDGNLQSVVANLGPIARTISREVGVMNEGDINRVLVDTLGMDLTKAMAYITTDPAAKVDPKVTGALNKLLMMAKEGLYSVAKTRLAKLKNQYRSRTELKDYMSRGGGDAVIDEQINSLSDLRADETYDKPKNTPLGLWVEATPEMRAQIVAKEEEKAREKANKKAK